MLFLSCTWMFLLLSDETTDFLITSLVFLLFFSIGSYHCSCYHQRPSNRGHVVELSSTSQAFAALKSDAGISGNFCVISNCSVLVLFWFCLVGWLLV